MGRSGNIEKRVLLFLQLKERAQKMGQIKNILREMRDGHTNYNDSILTVIPFGYEGNIVFVEKRSQVTIPENQFRHRRRPPAHRDYKEERNLLHLRSAGSKNIIGGDESDPTLSEINFSSCGHRENINTNMEDLMVIREKTILARLVITTLLSDVKNSPELFIIATAEQETSLWKTPGSDLYGFYQDKARNITDYLPFFLFIIWIDFERNNCPSLIRFRGIWVL